MNRLPLYFAVFVSTFFVFSTSACAQDKKYCQLSAKLFYQTDYLVQDLSFGAAHQKYADSLLQVCRDRYGNRKKDLNIIDALNFLSTLGWELHTVFKSQYRDRDLDAVYYILKRNENTAVQH